MAFAEVQGIRELKRALEAMSKGAVKELAQAGKRAGQIGVVEAKRLAPKGPHEGGGNVVPIEQSIHAVQSSNKVSIQAGGNASPHAAGAEFGGFIPRRGFKGRKAWAKKLTLFYGASTVTRIRKRPYLIPAVTNKLPEIRKAYVEMLDALTAKFRRA